MRLKLNVPLAIAAVLGIAGCTHPFIQVGANLAESVKKGDEALTALANSEANTQRIYRYAQSASEAFNIERPEELPAEFVGEVCRPHARVLISEHVALDNLEKYRAFLEANSKDPENSSLADIIASLSKTTKFTPTDPEQAATEYAAKKAEDLEACASNVRETFVAAPPAGALGVPAALAAWPKLRDFLSLLIAQHAAAKRERAIIDALTDSDTRQSLDASLTILSESVMSGRLAELAVSREQLALWSAYDHFATIKSLQSKGITQEDYGQLRDAATDMAASMQTYNDLAAVSFEDVTKTMTETLEAMREAADAGRAPDASILTDLLSGLDFLSAVADKYSSAASAL